MRTKWVNFFQHVTSGVITGLLAISTLPASAQFFEFDAARAKDLRDLNLNSRLMEHVAAKNLSKLKIAILDNGFGTFEAGEKTLPASAQIISNPAQALGYKDVQGNPRLFLNDHGLAMAQTVWAMTGLHKKNAPQLFLLNANGWTNFKYAVDWSIKNNVDIVLYAQNFEIGNMNGTGFINAKVNEATNAGIFWINAAGNYGQSVYNGSLQKNKAGEIVFPFEGEKSRTSLRFRVEKDSTSLILTTTWNDLKNSETEATTKDLDLVLLDSKGKAVTTSRVDDKGQKTQVPVIVNFRSDGRGEKIADSKDTRAYSTLPREQIEMTLNRGVYQIQLKDRSQNFSKKDKVRVMVYSQRPYDAESNSRGIDFIDRTTGYEVFTPGDNPNVITVGDHSPISSLGPNIDRLIKPDIFVADSRIELSDGRANLQGSSSAAAIFAGTLSLMILSDPDLDRAELKNFIKTLQSLQNTDIPTIANPMMSNDDNDNSQN